MSQRQILNYLFLLVNSAKVIHEFISSLLWKTLFFYLDVVTEERSMWTVVSRDVKFRLCRDGLMFWKDWWTELQPQQFLSLHQLKESDRMWTSAGFMTLRRKAAASFVVRLHQRLILHIPNMFHEQATKHAVWMLPGYHGARNRRKGHEGIRTVLVPGSGTGSTRHTRTGRLRVNTSTSCSLWGRNVSTKWDLHLHSQTCSAPEKSKLSPR